MYFYLVNVQYPIVHSFAVCSNGCGLATDPLSATNTDFKGRGDDHDECQDSQYKNGMFV